MSFESRHGGEVGHHLDVAFCGTAASSKSAAVGAYYAGPGYRLWRTLHDIALTPSVLQPHEFATAMAESISQTAVFVPPSTSAIAKRYWDIRHRRELAEFLGRSIGAQQR